MDLPLEAKQIPLNPVCMHAPTDRQRSDTSKTRRDVPKLVNDKHEMVITHMHILDIRWHNFVKINPDKPINFNIWIRL